MTQIKFIKEALVFVDGYTPTKFVAGDVAELSEELAAGIISEGKAVDANAKAAAKAAATTTTASTGEGKAVERMNKAELVAYAESLGLQLDPTKTNEELRAAIDANLAEKAKADGKTGSGE